MGQFPAMRSEQIPQRPGPQVANSPQPRGCKFPVALATAVKFPANALSVRLYQLLAHACPRLPIAAPLPQ